MKFSCEKALLQNAINTTSRAVSPKSAIPALEGILLEADHELRLTGYNLELGITKTISVSGMEDGAVILNASLLSNIVNRMPGGIVSLSTDERLLTVIEDHARQRGDTLLESDISITARPFFEKRGWQVVRENRIQRNDQLLINFRMRKPLK